MLKKQRFSFYVAAAAALCALLALVLFIVSNGTVGYPILNSSLAIYCTLGAFTACVCSLLAQIKNWNELLVSLLRLVALFLLFVALTVTLADRAVVAGGLFTWNSLDKYAWSAFYTGVACIAFQVAASLLMVVSGCMKQGAKK